MGCVEGFRNSRLVTVAQVVTVVLAATAVAIAAIAMVGRFHGAQQISQALGKSGKIGMLTAGSVVGAAAILTIVLPHLVVPSQRVEPEASKIDQLMESIRMLGKYNGCSKKALEYAAIHTEKNRLIVGAEFYVLLARYAAEPVDYERQIPDILEVVNQIIRLSGDDPNRVNRAIQCWYSSAELDLDENRKGDFDAKTRANAVLQKGDSHTRGIDIYSSMLRMQAET